MSELPLYLEIGLGERFDLGKWNRHTAVNLIPEG